MKKNLLSYTTIICFKSSCTKSAFITALVLITVSICLSAQNDNSAFCIPHNINPKDSNSLHFTIENGNYFKNMYYTDNAFEAGYKEIGYFLQPELVYYPNERSKFSAGIYLLKYSGLSGYTQATPVLSFQYHIWDGLDMVLGTLYGTTNHNLIEPIFQFDRYMNEHVENGLQFLLDKPHIHSDLWLNWEQFIFQLSPIQEQFTVGSSNNFILTNPDSRFQLKIPVQFLFAHKGGMDTRQSAPVQTLFNLVYGVDAMYNIKGALFKRIGLRAYVAHYADLSTQKEQPFVNGYGLYPNFIMEGKHWDVMLGYWNAYKFIAPRGDYLFQSVSSLDSSYTEARRQLLNFKLTYHHTIKRGIELGTRFESYYDLAISNFDYTYGVYILFNSDFFLTKVRSED